MHGRVQLEGCRSLRRTSSQHMRAALPLVTTEDCVSVEGNHRSSPGSSIKTISSDSFLKDDRKISVGDCALFKPPQDSPPFIGLIRWCAVSKDNNLLLGVNWLYRPAEIKLGKGIIVEGAPNEIFYSFHKDKIPAASLLHPCKVAFLPRGVDLPAGTSSFVCRRAYDITNKCLWWLTDQDYINERQEEVDQLLYKTRLEMHATLQSDGRSPKQANGPTSSQLKPASDGGQNSGTALHSQVKGKKRERGDHSAEPVKRERSLRSDDVETLQAKADNNLKSEISRITEKGGLMELEGVEKFVQLMHPDRAEKKLDLGSRSMLASVIAATDNVDCLNWFVQRRGLPVLDEWLQDIHKGKIGDGSGLKESDKSVEEFLLVLLRALDKLPVNLQALQMCNIGRSVNHLRSHKNLEIQKKARSLVDTWKKRVEAEMISIDAKTASSHGAVWSSKSRLPDSSHGVNRTPSGSDVAVKSTVTQNSASKIVTARSPHGESNAKSANSSPGHTKSSPPSSGKESLPRNSAGGTPDPPVREDRSSSSNQSHNYTQSLPGKEDGKSSNAVPVTGNKVSGSSTRNRKVSGFPGTSITGNQKEINSSRSFSALKSGASEKVTRSSLSGEKVLDGTVTEGSSHKLIVKIPNRVRSPAQGSVDDSANMSSRVSSPVHPDRTSEDKSDTHRYNVGSGVNGDSCQNDNAKEALTGSAEGASSPAALPDEEQSMTTGDSVRLSETPQTNQLIAGNLHASSYSPMNALIESCVKYSEADTASIEDDVGMKLLASVATGEMSRSDMISPTHSAEWSTPAVLDASCGDEAKSKSSPDNNISRDQIQSSNEGDKKDKTAGGVCSEDGVHIPKYAPPGYSGDRKCAVSDKSEDHVCEGNKHWDSSSMDVGGKPDIKVECSDKSNEKTSISLTVPTSAEKMRDGEPNEGTPGVNGTSSYVGRDVIANCKSGGGDVEEKAIIPAVDEGKTAVVDVASNQSCQGEQKNDSNEKQQQPSSSRNLVLEASNQVKVEVPKEIDSKNNLGKLDKLKTDREMEVNAASEIHGSAGLRYNSNELNNHHKEANGENKEGLGHISVTERVDPAKLELQKDKAKRTKSGNIQTDEADGHASICAGGSATTTSDAEAKMKFDLNEGVSGDESKFGEPANLMSSGTTSTHMMNSLAFPLNSTPIGHAASVTVAAAAKGPFVPPEDLLRSRGELGWKGSAATSAFRPAEPRKAFEIPLGSTNMPGADASTSKQGRMPLDFDLNEPDERALEEMACHESAFAVGSTSNFTSGRAMLPNEAAGSSMTVRCSSGGLDLDLNRADEACDNGICSTSGNHKGAGSTVQGKPSVDARRDFDLNDGPGVDDASVEPFTINHQVKGVMPPQLSSMGLRMNTASHGSFTSWFPAGNTYSTIAVPTMLPDRGEHHIPAFPAAAPQRPYGPSEVTAFSTPDVYRGSVLSSSPAVPFPANSFPYPVFPFGTTFPLPSATFSVGGASYPDSSSGPRLFAPPVHSQLLGPVGSVSSQFQRPYMVSLPDSNNHGLGNNRKWGRQGLDLNAGPGAVEGEVREEMFSLSSGQHSVVSSQALAEEQARIYSVTSGVIKRKEPEGGWDNESFRYKSWQ